ncbi:MAG TPA: carbamoyl-phosphate synthase large subunit [Dehalococcoidia bacterium]|nr:carbamoyl-phosphate synthase large subunit [Dehalococcoidia bacterium]
MEKPSSVLIIGSGPIVIGQAAEFDYAGTQACKAMREEGVRSILVNSNPATIMTDEGIADVVYIEPLTVPVLERIIARERPESLLATLGGQTGLNLAVALHEAGVLEKYNVRLLGTPLEAIRRAEDRELFKQLLEEIGEPVLQGETVTTLDAAHDALERIGLPAVIRPAFTLGGTGGGIAFTHEEFDRIAQGGMDASPIHQVLVEKYLGGWKEVEYEVMRDSAGTCITVCNMENLDPMGVHTGDSIVVAPSQTLSDRDYQMLRTASLKIIRALGIEGGCNVQFSLGPRPDVTEWEPGERRELPYYVIEVNPRVSRSSALASKATGYPIARVAAKIAVGRRLDEIPNAVTQKTTAAFEPALDYVVVKIPRWPFDKFPLGDRSLGTQMKATGEVMAIDRTFEGALQKAVRSLEVGGRSLLWERPEWAKDGEWPLSANDERLWTLIAMLRRGIEPLAIARQTGIDPWFLERLENLVAMERRLLAEPLTPALLRRAKRMGFSDRQIGTLADLLPEQVRDLRRQWNIRPVYKMVDTCAAEFDAATPYFYSTYEQENEAVPQDGRKALVIGSGPIRIGQGIEFDYCSMQAAWALQRAGYRALMANSNPETVSTDFDTCERLYFEPLDEEAVRDIIENETFPANGDGAGEGEPPASIVQFGGQTAINLAGPLTAANLPIIGSDAEVIDLAEDRRRFEEFLQRIGVPQPPGSAVTNIEDALKTAQSIGYPVLVRPSYVLGGRAMEIVERPEELIRYMGAAAELESGRPILIDKYLQGKEVEVDAICDGESVLIPGIMEHVERAGVHSGDSMAVYPGVRLRPDEVETLVEYTERIGVALGAKGLINIQYVILRDAEGGPSSVYVLEVNPRGSRTVPFLSKVTGVPMVEIAVNIMLGRSIAAQGYPAGLWPRQPLVAVKAPVFSMAKLVGVDTYLGPEMKSTGEVMGVDRTYPAALAKALLASGLMLPEQGAVLLTVADRDKPDALDVARLLHKAGYRFYATSGTAALLRALKIPVEQVAKRVAEGHPNVLDVVSGGLVDAVINTPEGGRGPVRDGFQIRRAAAERRIPCFTSIDTALAAAQALAGGTAFEILPLPEYRRPAAETEPATR